MSGDDVRYAHKTVQSIRGMEDRTRAKWEKDGWEFVEQAKGSMLRSKLTFRRPKKQVSRWVWVAVGAVVAISAGSIVIGAVTEGDSPHVSAALSTESAAVPSSTPSAQPTKAIQSPAAPSVTDSEVLETFKSYLDGRASSGVVLAKTVSEVTFSNGVLRVTFDPATASISQDLFDQINVFPNLASFVATAIAFNDDVGNRIRPMVDSIETVRADGSSLGTFSRADILALNGLSK